jgi:putative aldouronate transport system substrate-binding protein
MKDSLKNSMRHSVKHSMKSSVKSSVKSWRPMLAVSLSATFMISGCSGGTPAATGTNTTPATSSNTAKPVEKKVVTLKYLAGQDKFNPDEDFTRKQIKDLLGVELVTSMGNEPDKVNLILSSGQDIDMITMKASDRNALGSYIRNGAIQPLNELVDKYGPNLKKAFSKEVWDMVSSEGKIYALPTTNYAAVTDGIVIREDWLKKLNMPIPTTVDEFYNVLKAFKEKDPGGVGSKLIPFAMPGQDTWLNANGLVQSFGLGQNPVGMIEKDGKIVGGLETQGSKDYLGFLNKLYGEKLLDPDFPVLKRDKLIEKIGSGVVGAATLSCWDSAAQKALQAANPSAKLVFLAPLKSADNKQRIQNTDGLYQFLIVPKASKKAVEAVQYADAFLDPNNYSKLILGEEGSTYKKENGKYYPILPEFDKLNKGRFFYPVNESNMYTPLFGARARKEKEMGEMWDDINEKNSKFAYGDIVNFTPMMPAVEKYATSLDVLVKERLIKMVLDKNELGKFDVLVKEWKEKGGDAITADYNNWYKTRK